MEIPRYSHPLYAAAEKASFERRRALFATTLHWQACNARIRNQFSGSNLSTCALCALLGCATKSRQSITAEAINPFDVRMAEGTQHILKVISTAEG